MNDILSRLLGLRRKEAQQSFDNIEDRAAMVRLRDREAATHTGLPKDLSSAPPFMTGNGTVAEKNELAKWLVATYVQSGSVSLPFMLERGFDVRLCSLTAYCLALEIFSSYGLTFAGESLPLVRAVGLQLETMASGRVADTGQTGTFVLPAKYRGYGSALNQPANRGHLFQLNLCSFAEKNPIIGYQDWQGVLILPVKGMKPCGTSGSWKLFELDTTATDDMTALFICTTRGDVQIELAHFLAGQDNPLMFYRFSTIHGTPIEDHTKDYDNVN